MEGGFAAEEDQVGLFCPAVSYLAGKNIQPAFYGVYGEGGFPVLRPIDVAMGAAQVTSGQYMEKEV